MSEDELKAIEGRGSDVIAVAGGDYADWIWASRAKGDVLALVAEVRRLRAVVDLANTIEDCGDKDFCMWCGRENRQPHADDCVAFTPEGDVR